MNTFSVKQTFEEQLNQLWNDDKYKEIKFLNRGYAMQDIIELNSLMFIGINPAFDNTNPFSHFYNVALEGVVYKYFKKFQEISQKTNLKWTHIDLLFLRETNQKSVKEIAYTEIGWDFCQKQLEISKQIIQKTKPKIIVVSNAFARQLIQMPFCFKLSFDNTIGTYRIVEDSFLSNTPVFFTSMLTGPGALDLGSYERLVWHINHIKDK